MIVSTLRNICRVSYVNLFHWCIVIYYFVNHRFPFSCNRKIDFSAILLATYTFFNIIFWKSNKNCKSETLRHLHIKSSFHLLLWLLLLQFLLSYYYYYYYCLFYFIFNSIQHINIYILLIYYTYLIITTSTQQAI